MCDLPQVAIQCLSEACKIAQPPKPVCAHSLHTQPLSNTIHGHFAQIALPLADIFAAGLEVLDARNRPAAVLC